MSQLDSMSPVAAARLVVSIKLRLQSVPLLVSYLLNINVISSEELTLFDAVLPSESSLGRFCPD